MVERGRLGTGDAWRRIARMGSLSRALVALTLGLATLIVLASAVIAAEQEQTASAPASGRQVARIGYLEAVDAWRHRLTMHAVEQAIYERGWQNLVDFPPDAWLSAMPPHDTADLEERARALMQRDDIEVVFGLGTAAALALRAAYNGRTAVIALDVVNPVEAGLIETDWDSGLDRFTLVHQSHGWSDMFHLFHEFVSFRRLGAMHVDPDDGPMATKLREVARDGGYRLEVFRDLGDVADYDSCRKGIEDLIGRGIDGFLVPPFPCFDPQDPGSVQLITKLTDAGVATFAPEGASLVSFGALLGQSGVATQRIGAQAADMLIAILQGELPRSLPMVLEGVPSIAINLETAERLHIDLPLEVMAVADQVFLTRSVPQEPPQPDGAAQSQGATQ